MEYKIKSAYVTNFSNSSLRTLNLSDEIARLKSEDTWLQRDKNAITLYKGPRLSAVLVTLKKDAVLSEHSTDFAINFQVLEGKIKFTTDVDSVEIEKGQLLTLRAKIPHNVIAIEESAFLLTLAKGKE